MTIPASRPDMAPVVVIGAGVGGLAAAQALQAAGAGTIVLESSARPGGRIVTMERAGDRVDVGAQILHSSYRCASALMTGLDLRQHWRPVQGESCYSLQGSDPWIGSDAYVSPMGLRANLALYGLLLRVTLRPPPLHEIRDATALDAVSVADQFRGSDGMLSKCLLPLLCSAMNVATPRYTSMQHLLHILRITAFTHRYALPQGLEEFPRRLAGRVSVRYESPVASLLEEDGRVAGVILEGSGEVVRARHVIMAVAPHQASALLPATLAAQKQFFESVIKTPQALPVLFLDRPLPGNVISYMRDPRGDPCFWFAVDNTRKAPGMVKSGKSILTLWTQYPHCLELERLTDTEVTALALRELQVLVPAARAEWVEHVAIQRHEFSHPPYAPGSYRAVLEFMRDAATIKGLSFVGDIFGGAYMEASLRSVSQAVKRALTA